MCNHICLKCSLSYLSTYRNVFLLCSMKKRKNFGKVIANTGFQLNKVIFILYANLWKRQNYILRKKGEPLGNETSNPIWTF